MPDPVIVSAAVEGDVDEAVAQKLILLAGGRPGPVYGKKGKKDLQSKIAGYNNAARHAPWLVLVDLDKEECVPSLYRRWLPSPAPRLCFRVAVRQVEAWLMADAERLCSYLGVDRSRVSPRPEDLLDAKAAMVSLARQSHRKEVKEDMVPRVGGGRDVGPGYAWRLIEFVRDYWRPQSASERSESLHRAITCLRRLVARGG